jgi:hypothetical protein
MQVKPDFGYDTYVGNNKLKDKVSRAQPLRISLCAVYLFASVSSFSLTAAVLAVQQVAIITGGDRCDLLLLRTAECASMQQQHDTARLHAVVLGGRWRLRTHARALTLSSPTSTSMRTPRRVAVRSCSWFLGGPGQHTCSALCQLP